MTDLRAQIIARIPHVSPPLLDAIARMMGLNPQPQSPDAGKPYAERPQNAPYSAKSGNR